MLRKVLKRAGWFWLLQGQGSCRSRAAGRKGTQMLSAYGGELARRCSMNLCIYMGAQVLVWIQLWNDVWLELFLQALFLSLHAGILHHQFLFADSFSPPFLGFIWEDCEMDFNAGLETSVSGQGRNPFFSSCSADALPHPSSKERMMPSVWQCLSLNPSGPANLYLFYGHWPHWQCKSV